MAKHPENPEDTTPVDGLNYYDPQDSAAKWLRKGDEVHARLETLDDDGNPIPPLVHNFIISGVNGSRVYGSTHFPQGLSQNDGWRFELLSRPLDLPDTLTEIVAVLKDGRKVTLIGRQNTWTHEDTGQTIDPTLIREFTVKS